MLALKSMRPTSSTHWTLLQVLVVRGMILLPVRVSILGVAALYLMKIATPAPPMATDHL